MNKTLAYRTPRLPTETSAAKSLRLLGQLYILLALLAAVGLILPHSDLQTRIILLPCILVLAALGTTFFFCHRHIQSGSRIHALIALILTSLHLLLILLLLAGFIIAIAKQPHPTLVTFLPLLIPLPLLLHFANLTRNLCHLLRHP